MPNEKVKKITTVHEHPMRVPPSKKNPLGGITTRHQHPRNIYTSYKKEDLQAVSKKSISKGIVLPTPDDLGFSDGNKYDILIAYWIDHFNKLFPPKPPFSPLDPNVFKALIASESRFEKDPKNPKAFGITQVTAATKKALYKPNHEIKDYLFPDITQKDLLNPEIAIPVGVRWIFQKKKLAENRLKRPPTPQEIIMEYKGLLKSETPYHDSALDAFIKNYEKLTKK